MKKWIILLLLVGLVGLGYYFAQQQEFVPPWAQPKYGQVTRGDIRVPITASGLIHANRVVEVKSEASGEIIDIPVDPGSFVTKGDVLVELDPDDEQRTLDRARADYDRAQALLTQAEVAVRRARVNIDNAEARLEETQAQLTMSDFAWKNVEETLNDAGESDVYSDQEVVDSQARLSMARAQFRMAEIAVDTAKLSLEDAEAALKSQGATVESARKAVEDAQERLNETTIRASQDGIVTEVFVKEGMLVQSATQGFTGGTPLLRLADVSKKKVIARLDEADYGRVLAISPVDSLPEMPALREAARRDAEQIEQRSGVVRIMVDAFPDDVFEGRIERVEPQGKLNTGSSIIQFDVHVEITDDERFKLPLGAQAQVEFTVESAANVLRVPAEAVKNYEGERGVWIKTEATPNEMFGMRFVQCRFGISDGEYTQVAGTLGDETLSEGQSVYTRLPPKDVEPR